MSKQRHLLLISGLLMMTASASIGQVNTAKPGEPVERHLSSDQTLREWSHDSNGQLHLRWTETGGPKVQEPTRKGFGGRIIERMIAQQSGKARFDWHAEGLVCEITLQV